MKIRTAAVLLSVFLAGCANYSWRSTVPSDMRSVAVPTFENRTMSERVGAVVTQSVLREFQREGTCKIARTGSSALEIQGVVTEATRHGVSYDRNYGRQASEYRYIVKVEASLVDKKNGKVLFENRPYVGETTFLATQDVLTGEHDAAVRVGHDIARQIVDDVTFFSYPKADAVGK